MATALFANSPFRDGKPSGLLSTRAEAWTDTDNARCGVPACVFDPAFGYEQWIDYILDVPMYFLHRGEDYIDVAGQSFRDYLASCLAGLRACRQIWQILKTISPPHSRGAPEAIYRNARG